MTKSDITQRMAEQFNLPARHARLIVDAFFNNILRGLIVGEKVTLRGFGAFSIKVSKARLRRNPLTGAEIYVGERRSMIFKSGKALHQRLNKG